MIGVVALILIVWLYLAHRGLTALAPNREYKSGTIWCFWRWTKVQSEYILRLHIVKTPWFAVCLHWIRKPDAEPWLHDHPVSFLSLILRGGYAEKRSKGKGEYITINSWFNFVRGSDKDRHTIILVRKNTLTLALMGPKTREWGFWMPEGWVMWKDYYARLKAGENVRGEALITALDRNLKEHYTDALMRKLAGAPLGAFVDEDTRELDTAPAADFRVEEVTGDFTISREDFYKKVKLPYERAALEDLANGWGEYTPAHVAQMRAWAERDGVDVSTDEKLIEYTRSGKWRGNP